MHRHRTISTRRLVPLLWALLILPLAGQTDPRVGIEDRPIGVHSLTGATIYLAPTEKIEGTIVIRDGVITAVGGRVQLPSDARVHDLRGHTITAGWIDLDLRLEPNLPDDSESREGRAWNDRVHPELDLAEGLRIDEKVAESHREQGFALALAAPDQGILAGQAAFVRLTGRDDRRTTVAERVAQIAALEHGGWGSGGYPGSRMGAIALLRQSLYDAQWYREAWKKFEEDPDTFPRPEVNRALAALAPVLDSKQPLMLRSRDALDLLSLGEVSGEFSLRRRILSGSGQEQLWLPEIAALEAPVILPVNFPKTPVVDGAGGDTKVTLRTLEMWARAPENPIRVAEAGLPFALTPRGLSSVSDFPKRVRTVLERGLSFEDALASVTTTPAKIAGLSDRYGKLVVGASATLTVFDGTPFEKDTSVTDVWIDGESFPVAPSIETDVRGRWELTFADDRAITVTLEISGEEDKPRLKATHDGDELRPAVLHRQGNEVGLTLAAAPMGETGYLRLGGAYAGGDSFEGIARTPQGASVRFQARRTGDVASAEAGGDEKKDEKKSKKRDATEVWAGSAGQPLERPLGARGRTTAATGPKTILFTDATIWTSGPKGILQNADLLVRDGKIEKIGTDLAVPPGAEVVSLEGRHLTPGIVDPHSHTAIIGGVNEGTQAVTAEVRIGDVVEAHDINMYRQLAGGVTTAHLMHGSANPIGGQGQVIKLKWGEGPQALKVPGPKLIKCALGENVKQSNWSNPTGRYPQTRMGVEQVFRDAFWAAREYQEEWRKYRAAKATSPRPRYDLELEALAEILRGERWIHCHSYRQDEILMLMRVAEDFGFKIGTFQHVLEGYKIANEIQRHGAAASSFSDWWAFKFEVYDAIPHNGAVLYRAGVLTSFNSDSDELARRLNLEAAKAVKYGGVPRPEAFKFVTLNAAIQLGIGDRTGSLEVGKDADLAIWNGDPLSGYTRCIETWIEGKRYFSLEEDAALRARDTARRELLIARILEEKHGAPTEVGEGVAEGTTESEGDGR